MCLYSEIPDVLTAISTGRFCRYQSLNITSTREVLVGYDLDGEPSYYPFTTTHRCYVLNADGKANTTVSGRMWNDLYFEYQYSGNYQNALLGFVGVLDLDSSSSPDEAIGAFLAEANYKGLCQFGSLELQSMAYEELDGSVTVERQDVYETTDTLSCSYDGSSTTSCTCTFSLQVSHSEEPDLVMTAYLDHSWYTPFIAVFALVGTGSSLMGLVAMIGGKTLIFLQNKDQRVKRSKSRKRISIRGFETLKGQFGDDFRTQITQEPDIELEEAVKNADSTDQIV